MKQSKRVDIGGRRTDQEMRDYERNLLVLTPAFLEKVSLNVLKPLEMHGQNLKKSVY